MKIEDLRKEVDNFKVALQEIVRKRNQWEYETKNKIIETLKAVQQEFDLDWSVFVLEPTRNMEGVNLTFGNSFSGVYTESENGTKNYAKTGGSLVFSQAYNGDVFILLMYPNIDGLLDKTEPEKMLGKFDPVKIDEVFIYQKVSEFLIEMTDWESSKSSHAVGFK